MVNNTPASSAITYIKEDIKYSMPNEKKITQHRSAAMNMANEDHTLNSIVSSGTGDSVMPDITGRTNEYKQLIDYGLDAKVANRLDEIFKTGTKITKREYCRNVGGNYVNTVTCYGISIIPTQFF